MVIEELQKKEIENLISLQEAIELAKEKGIVRPKTQINYLTRNGKIETVRMGRQKYLKKEQLEKCLSESLFSIDRVDNKPSDFISISEAVKTTGYSRERINVLIHSRRLRAVKWRGHYFIDKRSIDENRLVLPDGYITVHQAAKKIKEIIKGKDVRDIRPGHDDYYGILRKLYNLTREGKIPYIPYNMENYDRCVPIETIESVRNSSSDLYKELFSTA